MGTAFAAAVRDCHIWAETWARQSSLPWEGSGPPPVVPSLATSSSPGRMLETSGVTPKLQTLVFNWVSGWFLCTPICGNAGCKRCPGRGGVNADILKAGSRWLGMLGRQVVPRAAITKFCSEKQKCIPLQFCRPEVWNQDIWRARYFWRLWGTINPSLPLS